MQHWQLPFCGLREFPADHTAVEIRYVCTFTPHKRAAIVSRYEAHHRLAAALQMGLLKMTGRTLEAFDTLPVRVRRPLSMELGLQSPELTPLRALYGRRQT